MIIQLLSLHRAQVKALPSGVHELPGMQEDPRTVDKLFDGVNATSDAQHMWLAPFTPGQRHTIHIDLQSTVTLARLRVWNYNASRAHAQRGARHFEVRLDGTLVYSGELSCSTAGRLQAESLSTIVMFTDEPQASSSLIVSLAMVAGCFRFLASDESHVSVFES